MRNRLQKSVAVLAACTLIAGFAGCSKNNDDNASEASSTASQSESENASANTSESEDESEADNGDSGATPEKVTLETVFGPIDYPYAPDRPAGFRSAVDELLALGISPVVFIGVDGESSHPWHADLLEDVDFVEFDDAALENVVGYQPNLLVPNEWYANDAGYYEMISEYIPFLAAKTEGFGEGNNWKYRLEALGKIYGVEEKAQQIVDDYQAALDHAKEELAGLAGKTVIATFFDGSQKQFNLIVNPEDPIYTEMRYFGLTLPENTVKELGPKATKNRMKISSEQLHYLDADIVVVLWAEGDEEVAMDIPGFSDLPAVREGHVIWDKDNYAAQAMITPTSLSAPWILENFLVPKFKEIGE